MQAIVLRLHETQQVSNPWQYAADYFESSMGLVKFGTRYHNPKLGRWTQQDPVGGSLGNPDSLNRYLYAKDDPVNLVDPSGRDAIITACLIGADIGVVVGAVALALSLMSGGAGISLIVFALTLYFQGGGDAIAMPLLLGVLAELLE